MTFQLLNFSSSNYRVQLIPSFIVQNSKGTEVNSQVKISHILRAFITTIWIKLYQFAVGLPIPQLAGGSAPIQSKGANKKLKQFNTKSN